MTKDKTMAITPECTLVWPDLYEPTPFKGSEEYYRATFLFEKSKDMSGLRSAINAAGEKKFPGQSEEFYKNLRYPIRNGMDKVKDENGNVDEESFFYNRNFMSVRSRYKPAIVNIYGELIDEPAEIYGGCIVRGYLSFFGYDHAGNKGVSCSLRALIKIDDGDPIGGGKVDTSKVFSDVIEERPKLEFSNEDDLEGDIGW